MIDQLIAKKEPVTTQPKNLPAQSKISSSKLRDLADKMQPQIDAKRNPAISQQNPTARRAEIADQMSKDADYLERVQVKLTGMADAIDAGTLPDSLKGITNKEQIKVLINAVKYNRSIPTEPYYADELKRMVAVGIDTEEKFEQAKKDIASIGTEKAVIPKKEQQIKKLERDLLNQKIPGFFPTPKPLAEKMVDLANIKAGDRVLEPSAGKGNIADAIKAKGVSPDVLETSDTLRKILDLKGYKPVGWDFTQYSPDKPYDVIIMNPPFEKGQDMEHVKRAYYMLNPGGRLVAIMSEGPFFRSDNKAIEFRSWLMGTVNGRSEKLPKGTFKESGTGVASRLVTITKGVGTTELYTVPNLKKLGQDIHSFVRPAHNAGALRVDKWIRDLKLNIRKADSDFGANLKSDPDADWRKEEFLDIVNGGVPTTPLQQQWAAKAEVWGSRAVAAGLFPAQLPDYVHYGFANPRKEISEAFRLLDGKKAGEWLEGVDRIFNTKSGSFKKRTSADWAEFESKTEKINEFLKRSGSEIVLKPQTDLAVMMHDWEKDVGRAVLNQEVINYLELYHVNPETGKPMITVKPETWGDPDYKLLPKNIKVKWLGVKELGGKMIPLKYWVHKDVYPILENFTESDLWSGSKLAQGLIGINNLVKNVIFFNPAIMAEKMTTRLIATGRGKPLLNMIRLRFPWYDGKQLLKNEPVVQEAIGSGLVLFASGEFNEKTNAPIDEDASRLKGQIEKILGYPITLNHRMVSAMLDASRFTMWKYLVDEYSSEKTKTGEPKFTRDQVTRMASEQANRRTYSIPKEMMDKNWRTIGRMAFISRNSIENLMRTSRSLAGGESDIFTQNQMKSMSKDEWKYLLAILGFFGLLPAILNKKTTGKFFNTDEGQRGKTAIYQEPNGRTYYVTTLDYVQDIINALWGQQRKLLGKLAYVPKQLIEQASGVNLITGKSIRGHQVEHAIRSALPGTQENGFWEDVSDFADAVKYNGWEQTFKEISKGEILDVGISLLGKGTSHSWVAMPLLGKYMDKVKEEAEKSKEEIERKTKVGDLGGVAAILAGQGKNIKEITKFIMRNPGASPLVPCFGTLPLEYKIKFYTDLQNDVSLWNRISDEEKTKMMKEIQNSIDRK